MFFRLLLESFRRQRRRKLLAGIAILLGTTAVTAMLALATTIGDRIHAELAVYGANIIVTPQAQALAVNIGGVNITPTASNIYLHESDLNKLQTIFWHNNITALSPEMHTVGTLLLQPEAPGKPSPPRVLWQPKDPAMDASGAAPVTAVGYWFHHTFGTMTTGAPTLHPWWKLDGRWPVEQAIPPSHGEAAQEIVLGSALARRLNLNIGDWISMGHELEGDIVGIVTTGDSTDQQILYPLDATYGLLPASAAKPEIDLDRVEVAARTRPEDAFARQNPDTLSPKQRDTWYCRPYANSIAYQIREAIPNADAQQIRRVEQSEGNVLKRISGLMWLISAAALLAAGFAVSAAMATAVLERRAEIGLMRSLGASQGRIAILFYVEAAILALLSGLIGYLAGSALAAWLGARIFAGAPPAPTFNPVLLPIITGLALLVAIAGSTPAIRSALRLEPSAILRSDA